MWNKLVNAVKWLWADPPPPPVFPPETSVLSMTGFKPDGFEHGIEILNDDKTSFMFVVEALQASAWQTQEEAVEHTAMVHRDGGAIIPLASQEEAVAAAEAIGASAVKAGFPLVCRAISATPAS